MKKFLFILTSALMLILVSCKKDTVDATNLRTFQSSINDMATRLNTLKQVKFNEALYILKTFGVLGESEEVRLKNLGALLSGKKVPEIMAMADQVAQRNSIAWSSSGPPSLGEMNIFGDEKASEFDANDIKASSLGITAQPTSVDSVLGPKALQVIPRLLDSSGKPIKFSGAALETVMEVFSNGSRVFTSKNLMQDNNFKGFNLRMSALPRQKVLDGTVDITVTVKTSKKNYKMTKVGVPINTKALLMPQAAAPVDPNATVSTEPKAQVIVDDELPAVPDAATPAVTPTADPKNTVSGFLGNLGSQNYRGAFSKADNPSWGSYETFSNPTSGFGGVKNVNVKSIKTNSSDSNSASVNATYDVTDKDGKVTSLNVTFGLKNVNGEWKISSYRIN